MPSGYSSGLTTPTKTSRTFGDLIYPSTPTSTSTLSESWNWNFSPTPLKQRDSPCSKMRKLSSFTTFEQKLFDAMVEERTREHCVNNRSEANVSSAQLHRRRESTKAADQYYKYRLVLAHGTTQDKAYWMQHYKDTYNKEVKRKIDEIEVAMFSAMLPCDKKRLLIQAPGFLPKIAFLRASTLAKLERFRNEEMQERISIRQGLSNNTIKKIVSLQDCTVCDKAMRAIRRGISAGHASSEDTDRKCKQLLQKRVVERLGLWETENGMRTSVLSTVEAMTLECIEMVDHFKWDKGGRTKGLTDEFELRFQKEYVLKVTFDARDVTSDGRHQTEFMIMLLPTKDYNIEQGVSRAQSTLTIRTLAIWAGKDSRKAVQHNTAEIWDEIQELEENGIVFDECKLTFAGVRRGLQQKYGQDWLEKMGPGFRHVKFKTFFPADYKALTAACGHGGCGNHFCIYCDIHRKDRPVLYQLEQLDKDVNFADLAKERHIWPAHLFAVNCTLEARQKNTVADKDFSYLTDKNIAFHTHANCVLAQSHVEDFQAPKEPASAVRSALQLRPQQRRGGKTFLSNNKPKVSSKNLAQQHISSTSVEEVLIQKLRRDDLTKKVGWKRHQPGCECSECVVTRGTWLLLPYQPPKSTRKAEWLQSHWKNFDMDRVISEILHGEMRVTEGLFYIICTVAHDNGRPFVNKLNEALQSMGSKLFFKETSEKGISTFEKVSMKGYQVHELLRQHQNEIGKVNIEELLDKIWPNGQAHRAGKPFADFVTRTKTLWKQWKVVVDMLELKRPQDYEREDVYNRFAPECIKFANLMITQWNGEFCGSFYLHIFLTHAQEQIEHCRAGNFTLWMMSNSGAELFHKSGRVVYRRSFPGVWSAVIKETVICDSGREEKDEVTKEIKNKAAALALLARMISQHGRDEVSENEAIRNGDQRHPRRKQMKNDDRTSQSLIDRMTESEPLHCMKLEFRNQLWNSTGKRKKNHVPSEFTGSTETHGLGDDSTEACVFRSLGHQRGLTGVISDHDSESSGSDWGSEDEPDHHDLGTDPDYQVAREYLAKR